MDSTATYETIEKLNQQLGGGATPSSGICLRTGNPDKRIVMDILPIEILIFIVMEPVSADILYFRPGSRLGNRAVMFNSGSKV